MSKQEKAVFVSKFASLRLVMQAADKVLIGTKQHSVRGKTIEFVRGVYETSDPEEIEFLRNHRLVAAGRLREVDTHEPEKQAAKEAAKEAAEKASEEGASTPPVKKKTKKASK